jgi:hypothetical protein
MKYAVTEEYFFIADQVSHNLIRADIANNRNQSSIFLKDVNLMDLWAIDKSLLIHRHGSSSFELYDIHTGNKLQDVEFPIDLKYNSIDVFSRGYCYTNGLEPVVCKLVYVDNKYSFQASDANFDKYLSTPILDDSISSYFSRIGIDNYVDQNKEFVLLRKSPNNKYASKYLPIYYVFDKRKKEMNQIILPKGLRQNFEGAAILKRDLFFYGYDKRTYELVLYKIFLAKMNLKSFDPTTYSFPDDQ